MEKRFLEAILICNSDYFIMSDYHSPVLLHESIDGLNVQSSGVYVDLTFGGGGHSKEILKNLGSDGRLFGFDQDEDTLKNIPEDHRFSFVFGNFQYVKRFITFYDVDGVDGVLADLGVSSHHFDDADRGFSFRSDAPLDMRMNQSAGVSASTVINEYTFEQLATLFRLYGEIKNAGKLAGLICQAREGRGLSTTFQLRDVAVECTPARTENQYLAKVFQAIRLEVNDEMSVLKNMLQGALDVLKPGGRLSVISYHSLEDRLVKNFFKAGNFEGKQEKDFYGNVNAPMKLVNRKVIVPSQNELELNPRARSAKLRVAVKNDI